MLGCKPSNTLIDPQIKLHSKKVLFLKTFTCIDGSLDNSSIYLTNIRLDICFAVNHLSQFLLAPTMTHYQATLRVLRYLKANPGRRLFFPSDSPLQLKGFCDSDWASCPETHLSVTDFYIFLSDSLISWRSKKQTTVSRSSSKAEYRALVSTTCEIQWLTYLLRDLHIVPQATTILFCDNKYALHLAVNPVFHEGSKHIEIDCHVVREKVCDGVLIPKLFLHLLSNMDLIDLYAPSEGGNKW